MIKIQQQLKFSDSSIIFKDVSHHSFYKECLQKAGNEEDVYHKVLFYLLGLTEETRQHINQFYDFDECCIKFYGFNEAWQTDTTIRICRLAFNLYKGYVGEETDEFPEDYVPSELFNCEHLQYMLEAMKIRYHKN